MIYEITWEELEQLDLSAVRVIDIRRAEDYARGSYPGAVNVPELSRMIDEDWEDDSAYELDNVSDDHPIESADAENAAIHDIDTAVGDDNSLAGVLGPAADGGSVYLLCHTGSQSRDAADYLRGRGYEAWSIAGGYRAYLKRTLDRYVAQEDKLTERTKEIERSLIKKFRKPIWRQFTKAVRDYELIQEGDRIACCISGGKDSMLMAKLLQEIQRHGKVHFDLHFLCMNPGYNEDNWRIIENNARILGLELNVFNTEIFDVVAGIDKNPCYLCARMRRGYLYSHAQQLGCNKIALGHHYDDVIETILMGILYSGKTETMMPKLHSLNFEGMEIIRPMYLIREEAVKAWRDYNDLHFIQCACRFTEMCATCGGEKTSKRDVVKKLIAQLAAEDPIIEQNIFNCVRDVNLRTILGYHKDQEAYHFLDDYDER